jgi:hypothetical protein
MLLKKSPKKCRGIEMRNDRILQADRLNLEGSVKSRGTTEPGTPKWARGAEYASYFANYGEATKPPNVGSNRTPCVDCWLSGVRT